MICEMATTKTRPRTRRASGKAWAPEKRIAFLSDILGGHTRVARLLGVSASQPTRWEKGEETPSLAIAERIIGLDAVVAQLLLVWDRSLVTDWLTTGNAHLAGARPIDVLKHRGSGEVLEAIRSEAAGAFA
jgi:transcriptional regulator with XRE-family HTH domain